MIAAQKIEKNCDTLVKGIIYYQIISTTHDLSLTQREVELLAYTNRRGTISSITAKNGYISIFGSSLATVNNMISKLRRKKLLVKDKNRIVINPALAIDLSSTMVLQIILKNESQADVRLLHTSNSEEVNGK